MADPGFPRGGAKPNGGRQPIIWPISPKNVRKLRNFCAGGMSLRPPPSHLDPPMFSDTQTFIAALMPVTRVLEIHSNTSFQVFLDDINPFCGATDTSLDSGDLSPVF